MAQLTWRVDGELVQRVRAVAAERGVSMNEYVTRILDAATNPEYAGDEWAQVEERLRRAGLLAPVQAGPRRADSSALAKARREASSGTSLSTLVHMERGE